MAKDLSPSEVAEAQWQQKFGNALPFLRALAKCTGEHIDNMAYMNINTITYHISVDQSEYIVVKHEPFTFDIFQLVATV